MVGHFLRYLKTLSFPFLWTAYSYSLPLCKNQITTLHFFVVYRNISYIRTSVFYVENICPHFPSALLLWHMDMEYWDNWIRHEKMVNGSSSVLRSLCVFWGLPTKSQLQGSTYGPGLVAFLWPYQCAGA